MHISGASCHWGKKDAAETGILMELQLENKYLNHSHNFSIWDGVLWAAAKDTENLDIYMNTSMHKVRSDGKRIEAVECYQMNTEISYEFKAGVYIDATGNGTLGYFASAGKRRKNIMKKMPLGCGMGRLWETPFTLWRRM